MVLDGHVLCGPIVYELCERFGDAAIKALIELFFEIFPLHLSETYTIVAVPSDGITVEEAVYTKHLVLVTTIETSGMSLEHVHPCSCSNWLVKSVVMDHAFAIG